MLELLELLELGAGTACATQRKEASATELDRRDARKSGTGAGLPSWACVACRLLLLNADTFSFVVDGGGPSEAKLASDGRAFKPMAERCLRATRMGSDAVDAAFSKARRPPTAPSDNAPVGVGDAGVGEFSCSRKRLRDCGMGERLSPGEKPNMSARRSSAPERSASELGGDEPGSTPPKTGCDARDAETERGWLAGRSAMGDESLRSGDSPSTSIRNGDDSGSFRSVGRPGSDLRLAGAGGGGGARLLAGAAWRCDLLHPLGREQRDREPPDNRLGAGIVPLASFVENASTGADSTPLSPARNSNAVFENGGRSFSA